MILSLRTRKRTVVIFSVDVFLEGIVIEASCHQVVIELFEKLISSGVKF